VVVRMALLAAAPDTPAEESTVCVAVSKAVQR
jgi:hypothetical protein